MAAEVIKQSDDYTVTNGTVQWQKEGTSGDDIEYEIATALGCTGSLAVETELKVVTKMCEGVAVKSTPIPQKITATLTGHMPVAVLRKSFGLSNKDLATGVYAYGMDSRSGKGIFTWEVWNLEETIKKFMAFPNGNMTGGFKFNLENGGDEIAQVEMTMEFLKDENRKFYYEAYEKELEDENIKEKWMKNFNLELIAKKEGQTDPGKNGAPPSDQTEDTEKLNQAADKSSKTK